MSPFGNTAAMADGPGHSAVIKHYSPDTGYNASIQIRCNRVDPSSVRYLVEGQSSTNVCGKDTDDVYVRANEEIWCKYAMELGGYIWAKKFDGQGWHNLNGILFNGGVGCVVRRD